jgi:glycolate oxidase FAD binding subunit
VLLIKFDGSHNGVEYQAKNASAIIERSQTTHVEVIENDVSMWRALAAMPVKHSENIISRVSVSPTDIERVIPMLETSNTGKEGMWHASVGVGRVRVIDQTSHETALAGIISLRSSAEKLGGSLIIEDGPTEIRQQLDVWGDLGDSAGLMQRIKRQLDPDRILSPGRFSAAI